MNKKTELKKCSCCGAEKPLSAFRVSIGAGKHILSAGACATCIDKPVNKQKLNAYMRKIAKTL